MQFLGLKLLCPFYVFIYIERLGTIYLYLEGVCLNINVVLLLSLNEPGHDLYIKNT